jgi:hypothetical protein
LRRLLIPSAKSFFTAAFAAVATWFASGAFWT